MHTRESADEVLRVLEEYKSQARGVLHCFLQEKYVADTVIKWGWYLGIDGPITYPKNKWLREVIAELPLEHLVFETDSPFLPPQQFRGKQNGPYYVPLIAQTVAELKNMGLEEVARITTENVKKLWGI